MLRTLIVLTVLLMVQDLPCGAQQVRVSGSVVSMDSSAQKLVMKMDAGPELTVRLSKTSTVLQAGQRIVVNGRISRDEKAVDAVEIVTASDNAACADKAPIHSVLANLQRGRGCAESRLPPTE